jgi:hypothetical protein
MGLEEIGSLLIRVTIGLLFLISAFVCSKDAGARKAATADTALVFPWHSELFMLAGVALWRREACRFCLGSSPVSARSPSRSSSFRQR